ncbi:hypothetical protein Tco_0401579 [Tanacetum coccineum]
MAIGTGYRSNNYSESKRNDHLDKYNIVVKSNVITKGNASRALGQQISGLVGQLLGTCNPGAESVGGVGLYTRSAIASSWAPCGFIRCWVRLYIRVIESFRVFYRNRIIVNIIATEVAYWLGPNIEFDGGEFRVVNTLDKGRMQEGPSLG